jgi:hypothetical protein
MCHPRRRKRALQSFHLPLNKIKKRINLVFAMAAFCARDPSSLTAPGNVARRFTAPPPVIAPM